MAKYLRFYQLEFKGKTVKYAIRTLSGEELGIIKWFSHWRRYCLYPSSETIWDTNCLKEVFQFIGKLMEDR